MNASPSWLLCAGLAGFALACDRAPNESAPQPPASPAQARGALAAPNNSALPAPSAGALPAPSAHALPAPSAHALPAAPSTPAAPAEAAETAQATPPVRAGEKTAGVVEEKRAGEPRLLRAVRAAKNAGYDRVVFEFEGGVPGYHFEYVDRPVRDCGSGDEKTIAGDGWLEARFSPANAHREEGQPTVAERELSPRLPIVREIERTCDFEAVVTWVIGTASPNRYRVLELDAPPRIVVDIDH